MRALLVLLFVIILYLLFIAIHIFAIGELAASLCALANHLYIRHARVRIWILIWMHKVMIPLAHHFTRLWPFVPFVSSQHPSPCCYSAEVYRLHDAGHFVEFAVFAAASRHPLSSGTLCSYHLFASPLLPSMFAPSHCGLVARLVLPRLLPHFFSLSTLRFDCSAGMPALWDSVLKCVLMALL